MSLMETSGTPEAISNEVVYAHEHLEKPNWAPWLQFSEEELQAQQNVFPDGQFSILGDDGLPVAILATNRIDWDGSVEGLPTWDEIAGESFTFAETYIPSGNTVSLMSMSVSAESKGQHLPEKLVGLLQEYAAQQGVEHIIGDFRPSNYSVYKQETEKYDFVEYVSAVRETDQLPVDGWLRNVTRLGMKPLRIDHRAMVVPASVEELMKYQQEYKPNEWRQVTDQNAIATLVSQHKPEQDLTEVSEVWECGETGTWYVDKTSGVAVYIESNFWGELPVRVA